MTDTQKASIVDVSQSVVTRRTILGSINDGRILPLLESADVLFLPLSDKPEFKDRIVFTGALRDWFLETRKAAPQLTIEVATDLEAPPELELHADWFYLGRILVKEAALPILLSALANIITNRLTRSRSPQDSKVRAEIIIESPNGCASVRYEGPASSFDELVKEAFRGKRD